MSQSNFVKKKLELRIKKNVNYVPVKSTSSFSFVSLCLPPWHLGTLRREKQCSTQLQTPAFT